MLKDEFEKAFESATFPRREGHFFGRMRNKNGVYFQHAQVAFWAARWMGEKCALLAESAPTAEGQIIAYEIRTLVKELGGE